MILLCDSHDTCLRNCIAKSPVDTGSVSRMDWEFLTDPGSCWHNNHIDGEYREASIKQVKEIDDEC